jgi:cytochrome c5
MTSTMRTFALTTLSLCGLLLATSLSGCEDDVELGSCPPDAEQQEITGRETLERNCNTCHASDLTGATRQEAPTDLNFDELPTVRSEAQGMYETIVDGSMPPDVNVPESEKEAMRVWLACGGRDVR